MCAYLATASLSISSASLTNFMCIVFIGSDTHWCHSIINILRQRKQPGLRSPHTVLVTTFVRMAELTWQWEYWWKPPYRPSLNTLVLFSSFMLCMQHVCANPSQVWCMFVLLSLSRNISGSVGWRDAAWLRSPSECPIRHGGRHPFPSAYLYKLPPLRFRAQQWYSSAGPDGGGGSWSSYGSRHPDHQCLHVQHGQQREQPRSVSWRVRTDGTQRGWAAEGEEEGRTVSEVHPVRTKAEEVRVQELTGLTEVKTELV